MPTTFRPVRRALGPALALAALALPAGDLDIYFSNQSLDDTVQLILDEAGAGRGDVFFSLLDMDPAPGRRPVPVLLQGSDRSRLLAPGQTAVLHLLAPPVGGSEARRRFRVVQPGRTGGFDFTFRVALLAGLPHAEICPGAEAPDQAEFLRPDPDLLVFWKLRPGGA